MREWIGRSIDALALVAAWLLLGGAGAFFAWREGSLIVALILFAFATAILAAAFLMRDDPFRQ